MADVRYTPEQERAIDATGSVGIRAGAGTGKTGVLAARFVALLRPRGDQSALVDEVRQILAITFTDKAAAGVKERIRTLVAAELERAAPGERASWERVRRELLGAQISTIHAFCARIVRENPLEAGIDPEAAILDEHEGRAWVEGIVEDELIARLRRGDAATTALLRRRRSLRGGRDGGAVGAVVRILERLGTSGRDPTWLAEALARQEALAPGAEAALEGAKQRIAAAVRGALDTKDRSRKVAKLRDAWPGIEPLLAGFGPASPAGALVAVDRLARLLPGLKLPAAVDDALRRENGVLRGTLPEEWGFLATLPEARLLTGLLADLATAVRLRQRADGVLTFDALVTEARRLLVTHPGVRARYAGRFRAILVDEFQDTDAVQAEVVRQLASGGALLFVVGDEKQSIYRFRGADVAVFQETRAALGAELALGTNFRSQPAVLEFVNALAARTLCIPPGSRGEHWTVFGDADRLVADRAQEWPRPAVRLVSFVPRDGRAKLQAEVREVEGRVLAGVVADMLAREVPRVRPGEIAVLFRTLNQVKAYEYALRRREIPYYVVKGRGFFQCQEVRDVVSLLGAIADPRDEVALAAALRSPMFGVDDDTLWRLAWPADAERPRLARRFRAVETFADFPVGQRAELARVRDLLAHLRRARSRATLPELFAEALAATDFEPVCLTQFQGMQKVANVRKLIELARTAERRRHVTLREFVRFVRELTTREAREPEAALVGEHDDVVRLMTIHQAKGLEFPVVILVDLGRALERERDTLVLDDTLGVLAAPVSGVGAFPLRHARLEEYRARERDRARAEHARLLYVACTRARDHLVLLEGRGEPGYLADGKGDPFVWCHQVWDLLGRERVQGFVAGEDAETELALAGGGTVLLERAERYLAPAGAADAPMPAPRTAPPSAADEAAVERALRAPRVAVSEVVTSPTALADFVRCPRQYWYRHVLELAERGQGGARARLLGTAAHGVLEVLPLEASGNPDPEPEVRAYLAAMPETLALSSADVDSLTRDVTRAARALRAEVAAGLVVVGREVPFVLPLPVGRPRLLVQGRIDFLGQRGATAVVRDYKYARASAGAAMQYVTQLAAYQLAVAGAGGGPVEADVLFLRDEPVRWAMPALDAGAEGARLLEAGISLGEASGRSDADAFPRRPPDPDACTALGCGYVRRCWGGAGHSYRRASSER